MNRTRALWRRAAATGVATMAIAGLVACGSGSKSGGGSAADDSGTDDLSKGDKLTSSQVSDIVTKATNALTTAHIKMDTKAQASGQSVTMSGEGDIQAKPLAEDLTMKLSGPLKINSQIVYIDNTIYMKGLMGNGWVKMTADQLAKAGGQSLSSMTNPLDMLKEFSKSVKSATYEGSEKVDGDDLDHYKLTVDGSALTSAVGAAGSGAAGATPSTLTEDMWVDGDDHIRKTQIDMGTTGTVTAILSDYGKKVDIKAPPASQVQEMPSAG